MSTTLSTKADESRVSVDIILDKYADILHNLTANVIFKPNLFVIHLDEWCLGVCA
jgi:hypothetical protein